jgi:hypothetical protein
LPLAEHLNADEACRRKPYGRKTHAVIQKLLRNAGGGIIAAPTRRGAQKKGCAQQGGRKGAARLAHSRRERLHVLLARVNRDSNHILIQ